MLPVYIESKLKESVLAWCESHERVYAISNKLFVC